MGKPDERPIHIKFPADLVDRLASARAYHDEFVKPRTGGPVDRGAVQGVEVAPDEARRRLERLIS